MPRCLRFDFRIEFQVGRAKPPRGLLIVNPVSGPSPLVVDLTLGVSRATAGLIRYPIRLRGRRGVRIRPAHDGQTLHCARRLDLLGGQRSLERTSLRGPFSAPGQGGHPGSLTEALRSFLSAFTHRSGLDRAVGAVGRGHTPTRGRTRCPGFPASSAAAQTTHFWGQIRPFRPLSPIAGAKPSMI